MGKSNERSTVVTVGIITALATVCAALIGGLFLIFNSIISKSDNQAMVMIPTSVPPTVAREENLWIIGSKHPAYPHVVASQTEGIWVPERGYTWANPNDTNDLGVVWEASQLHPKYANVVAADTEGDWVPAPGYKWASPDDDDDFTVIRVYGDIENVTVEHDVSQNGEKGMLIHVKFTVEEMQEIRCHIAVYFYHANGDILVARSGSSYSAVNGQLAIGQEFIPKYTATTFNDYPLFVPYSALNLNPGNTELKYVVRLYNWRDRSFIADSMEYYFTY